MKQYDPIKSEQIKTKNTLCMQCEHQNCLMITDGVYPVFAEIKQEIPKIKEEN